MPNRQKKRTNTGTSSKNCTRQQQPSGLIKRVGTIKKFFKRLKKNYSASRWILFVVVITTSLILGSENFW
jgi:hypothetical protein